MAAAIRAAIGEKAETARFFIKRLNLGRFRLPNWHANR